MSRAERRMADALNRHLDGLVESHAFRFARRPPPVDPSLARTAEILSLRDDALGADALFADRLLNDIMPNAGHLPARPQLPLAKLAIAPPAPSSLNARQSLPGRGLLSLAHAHLATAALLLVTIASALLFVGPVRRQAANEPPGIAMTGFPDSTGTIDAAELLWDSRGDPSRPIDNPGHLTVDPAGNLWVVDPRESGFQILSPDGAFLERWGEAGAEPGQFELGEDGWPYGAAAFDDAGNLFIADAGNQRVQQFAPDRSFIRAWGEKGTGDGQFLLPDDIAIDRQGRVYVLDGRRDDIQVFDADGTYLRTIGRYGVGEGQFLFYNNGGLTIDRRGNLWVADISNHRIQRFSLEGKFLAAIGKHGYDGGEFSSPNGIAVDSAGRLFVGDVGKTGPRVQVLSADGVYLGAWSASGSLIADQSTATSLALDGNGNVYVADNSDDRILKLRLLPPFAPAAPANDDAMLEWQATGGVDQPLDHPAALAIDPDGRVWVADSFNHGYQIFSTDGMHIENWGTPGSEPGQFNFQPTVNVDPLPAGGIAFEPDGSFYVADSGNARVQKFGPDRTLLFGWGVKGEGDGQFLFPTGVAIDPNGRVCIADALRNDIQVFTAGGAFLDVIGSFGTDQNQLYLVSGGYVTSDGSGNLWVTDSANHRLQKFSGEGEFMETLGRAGKAQGQFSAPGQIAIDADGRLFVADRTNRRVQIFDREGTYLTSIGDEKRDPVFFPAGTALDGAGGLYVSDFFEDRVLKFRLPPSLTAERPGP